MNPELKAFYQDLILQHNKQPIHFYAIEAADHILEAYNPICGDRFKVFLKLRDQRIIELSFQGYGCAISKASTSVMVEQLKGKTLEEAKQLIEVFYQSIESQVEEAPSDAPSAFSAFSAVQSFPGRKPCVVLAWEELETFVKQP
ncbi:MAG: Fe-S cluster assembly sulfur transfer protein SufU [Bacteroidota bacterium]